VQTRLEGTLRPAAFLSGGVDSSLLCAIAGRQRPNLTAITVGFDGAAYDEAPIAQRIATRLGILHEVVRFSHDDYLSAFEALSQHQEQPMADPATPATLLAYGHCHRQFDVVLDGMGADESVGAMPPRHVRLAVGYASLIPTGARAALTRLLHTVRSLSGYTPILDFEHPADTMIRWRGFSRPEIEALCGEPVSFADTAFYRAFAGFPRHAHYQRYTALLNAMPCERLNQATLLTGARVRYPFWDRETDRFIRQLPTGFRYLPEEHKRILRAVLARYLPRNIWDIPKHSFDFPLSEFLSADDFRLVRRHLDPDFWRQTGLLSGERIWPYAQRFMAGDQSLKFRIWALVVLGAWLEKHGELR
jgi:asparagine synthase (glutamine-hydrolysing)